MKKVVEKVFCDDCHREIDCKEKIITLHLPSSIQDKADYVMDFCLSCVTRRVNHSFTIAKNIQCPDCKGKGRKREWTGIGSDYNEVDCERCWGKGVTL